MITAHRGDQSAAPENTLSAFEAAIENGADYIELDVTETKDGVLVILHDDSLMRTAGLEKISGMLPMKRHRSWTPEVGIQGILPGKGFPLWKR